jgi:hypothetical protein
MPAAAAIFFLVAGGVISASPLPFDDPRAAAAISLACYVVGVVFAAIDLNRISRGGGAR